MPIYISEGLNLKADISNKYKQKVRNLMALKIMTFDAADLIRYDKKTKQIVPSNLSMYSEIVDKKTGEIIQIKNKRLFRMRQEDSMVLDELMLSLIHI